VRVLCAAEPSEPAALEGVSIRRLPYRGKIGNTNICWSLGRAIRREGADVFHASLPTAGFADRAAIAAARRKIPFVLTYYNDLVGRGHVGLLANLYNRLFLPALLRRSARVIVSRRELDWLSPLLDSVRHKVIPIPLGVDLHRFSPDPVGPSAELRVGFLSILDEQHRYKGLAELLYGIAAAKGRGSKLRLSIAGDGSDRHRYEALSHELGIWEVLRFLGRLPDSELPAFYRSVDVFALPSTDRRQEGFGLVALEAMACGRPVLVSKIPAVAPDVRAHNAGWVLESLEAGAIGRSLAQIARNPEDAIARGRNARAVAEREYSWSQVAGAYLEVFRELTDESALSAS